MPWLGVVGLSSALGLIAAPGCRPALPAEILQVSLAEPSDGVGSYLRLQGLSSDELIALRRATWNDARWRMLWHVAVEESQEVAVAGRYVVTGTALEFHPTFPFDPGRRYVVRVDPAHLPAPRDDPPVMSIVASAPAVTGPPAEVSAIYPSSETWPANLLRFYVHFSAPMARGSGVAFVRLYDDQGDEVRDALLEAPVDFWSPDQRRYTVFFDPGRVKTDLVPNVEMGRALVPGRTYTLVISKDWPNAVGGWLREEHRKTFVAGPPVERPLRLSDWTLSTPTVGSRDPLVLSVPWMLDRALFERALGVERDGQAVGGRVDVARDETEWRFTPEEPWRAGAHALVALSVLEDPAGNLIDQAFEVDPREAGAGSTRPERYRIAFVPR